MSKNKDLSSGDKKSSSRNKVEVQVIDEKLLVTGIRALDKDLTETELARQTEINLVEEAPLSSQLTLSFKNIGRIENLVGFHNLAKLCLDNNLITEIIGLDHLTQLKWLDLSFNKIEVIRGLDNLKLLEDLSLFSNKIENFIGEDNINPLENCPNLQCLSLGNNKIVSLEQVKKLRKLKSIRMLTLAGNAIDKEPEYKLIVLAYVENLKYLDYALITKNDLDTAQEQYHDELMDEKEKESVNAEKETRDIQLNQYLKELDGAGIEFAHTLFDSMFFEDTEIDKLKHLPGVKEAIEAFRNQFKSLSEDFVREAMSKYEKKRADIDSFNSVVAKIREKADNDSTVLIESFNVSKKATINILNEESVQDNVEYRHSLVTKMMRDLEDVNDELMSIEIRLVEKFEKLVDDYENHLTEFKNVSSEMQTQFFRTVEELQEKFAGNIRAVATDLIDRLSREELAEDYLDEEAMALVVDRDTCMGIIGASHDMHIGRILKRDDDARNTEGKRYLELINGTRNVERARNRSRILQIHDFCRGAKHALNLLLSLDDDDMYDDDRG